ncbi:PAP2 superfamily protein [Amycolatopsis marina]|uniref:PAP2 superfamily protein n=1 Tax=Amycolatopsis marina TaxID=490629 RepID=A0A1I1AZ49_9PSEU|nr:PAP2 superfamily protein [Amycolatopsis marina]
MLTCVVFVWTRAGQRLDGELLPRAERGGGYAQETALAEPAGTVLSFFGDLSFMAAIFVALLVVTAWNRRFLTGVAGIGVVLCSVAAARVLKLVLARPDLGVASSTTHNSFPSGHVTAAASLLLAFVLVVAPPLRWWLAVPGVAGVAAVSAATMISGWHRLSDVLGGLLLAVAVTCVAASLLQGRRRSADTPRASASATGRTVVALVSGAAVVGTAAALAAVDGAAAAVLAACGCTVLTLVPALVVLPAPGATPSAGAQSTDLR